MVARPELPLRRAADAVRADWEVADLVHSLFAARDAATVLVRLKAALAEWIRHDEIAVYAVEPGAERLRPVGESPLGPAGDGRSVAVRAVQARRPVLLPTDPEPYLRLVGAAPHPPVRLGVPLAAHGTVLGAVAIELEAGLADHELELAFRLCDAGALALANANERAALERQAFEGARPAGELQRLGRLAEVAERVRTAALAILGPAGVGVYVVRDGSVLHVGGSLASGTDLALARRTVASDERLVERGDGARAGLPLRCAGRTIGSLLVAADGLREAKLGLLELLADGAAVALENALVYEAALEESARAVAAGVESLANALEASDGYTHEHARWIADFSCEVARELGVDVETVGRVEVAALLHDIGKIGIGESVLLKPGRLNAAERAAIERHPELGEQILAPIGRLREVRRIVRHCHERWDGAGYPDGLSGEEIPLEARIIFACDAFHAMTSDRPYRKAIRRSEAIRRLQAGAGTQFDPTIVGAVLEVLRTSRT